MIVIEITNTEKIIDQQLGKFKGRVVRALADDEAQVEKKIIEELLEHFKSNGVEAKIFSIVGLKIKDKKIEIPTVIRSSDSTSVE